MNKDKYDAQDEFELVDHGVMEGAFNLGLEDISPWSHCQIGKGPSAITAYYDALNRMVEKGISERLYRTLIPSPEWVSKSMIVRGIPNEDVWYYVSIRWG